jgi:hypothetical protein
MGATIVPSEQDHVYGNNSLPGHSELFSFSALDQFSALGEQSSSGSGDFENGQVLMKKFRHDGLRKSASQPTAQGDSENGCIRTMLEREACDVLSSSDLSGPPWELRLFPDQEICGTNWQQLESVVPKSKDFGPTVRSEFADAVIPDPAERSPSLHLTAVPDLSGPSSNSTGSIAGSSSQTVWNCATGEEVFFRPKRSLSTQERARSQAIRELGGQCTRCKKGKRKVCLVWPGSPLPPRVYLTFLV